MKTIAIANQKGVQNDYCVQTFGHCPPSRATAIKVDLICREQCSCYCDLPPGAKRTLNRQITELLMKVAYEKPLSHRECVYSVEQAHG